MSLKQCVKSVCNPNYNSKIIGYSYSDSDMIQDMLMCEIIKKAYSEVPINSRTCYNHVHPLVYPMEYDECPGCGFEKITRVTLGVD